MKHKVQVLTEEDIMRMDANRKPKNFFAFVRSLDGDLRRVQPQACSLSREAEQWQEGALESLESACDVWRGGV